MEEDDDEEGEEEDDASEKPLEVDAGSNQDEADTDN